LTLLLTNADLEQIVIAPSDIVDAMEVAYRELHTGAARSELRGRMIVPDANPARDDTYFFGYHIGAVPAFGHAALRFDSLFAGHVADEFGGRHIRTSDFAGLVLLFSLENAELVGILHDHWLSTRRVAATTALGASYLARRDSRRLGLFGTGTQARQTIPMMLARFDLDEIVVFSPDRSHREQFVSDMSSVTGSRIRSVDSPHDAASNMDIVVCATNSSTPVLEASWLSEGTHLSVIVSGGEGDSQAVRSEIDTETVCRADVIVVNSIAQIQKSRQVKLLRPIESGRLNWDQIYELAAVVSGDAPGRSSPAQITLFDNNSGMGIQFAALGTLVLDAAASMGLGTNLDTEMFMTRGGNYAP